MSNEVNLNNCSEDIFQSFFDASEGKLRRSQRILERSQSQKTLTCDKRYENILEDDTVDTLKESLPPNRTHSQTQAANFENGSQIISERDDENSTPDFSYMFNTEAIEFNPSELEATQKQSSNSAAVPLKDLCKNYPLDLRLISKEDSIIAVDSKKDSQKVTTTRTKRREVSSTSLKNVEKAPIKMFNGHKGTGKDLEKLVDCVPKSEVQIMPSVVAKSSVQRQSSTKDSSENLFQTIKPTSKQENIIKVYDELQKQSKHAPIRQTTQETNITMNENKSKQLRQCNKTVQKLLKPIAKMQNSKKRGRPKQINLNLKKQQQKVMESKPAASKPTTIENYIAPKVVRYYNSCPIMQNPNGCSSGLVANSQSLLPAVYPPHFTQQIIIPTEVPTYKTPITCLTPENSQVLTQLPVEVKRPSSTPVSVGSLQEFFEMDELYEILNDRKIIYNFTELHVRALALTLNLNPDNLFTLMDKIVELDANVLREKCNLFETKDSKSILQNEI